MSSSLRHATLDSQLARRAGKVSRAAWYANTKNPFQWRLAYIACSGWGRKSSYSDSVQFAFPPVQLVRRTFCGGTARRSQ